ncbi:Fatty acyl-CoA reductase [Theobroma cacao]|nr:Fatty acyl-CoA reductase [Theobroma cacao]
MKTFTSMESLNWLQPLQTLKLSEHIKFTSQAKYMATVYASYNFYTKKTAKFDDSNMQGLIKGIEKKKFRCEVKSIEWEDYICNCAYS